MVFPQAEFEIVPDSQAASPDSDDEGSISLAARSANPKNPNVADVLRLLSLETVDDTETLPTGTASGSGIDNNKGDSDWGLEFDNDTDPENASYLFKDHDYNYNLQESQDPTIGPAYISHGADLIQSPQVHGAISAFSARSLSTTISTTVAVTPRALPPPPTVETTGSSESSGPPAPNKPTRASKRCALRLATHDQQPDSDSEAAAAAAAPSGTDSPGPSEVCLPVVLVTIVHLDINIKYFSHIIIRLKSLNLRPSTNVGRVLEGVVEGHGLLLGHVLPGPGGDKF